MCPLDCGSLQRTPMVNALILAWGIALVACAIALMDWYARRKDRHSGQQPRCR